MHPLLFKIKRMYRKEKLPDPTAYLYKWFGVTPQGVMQVGANTGQEIKKFHTEGIKFGAFIEPLPKAFTQLQLEIGSYENYVAVNALCASSSGKEVVFHVSEKAGGSSSMLKPSGHLVEHPDVKFDDELKLSTTTLDEIVEQLKKSGKTELANKLDMLVIDVQGAELEVLMGAEKFLKQVKYVFLEISHGGLYEGDVPVEKILEYMLKRGYRLAFAYTNKHGWGDALFVSHQVYK